MSAKRLAARFAAVIVVGIFVVAISVGAYCDAGGWLAVAVVWGISAVAIGLLRLLVWATENWNTP